MIRRSIITLSFTLAFIVTTIQLPAKTLKTITYSPYSLSSWLNWADSTLDVLKVMVTDPTETSALTASNPFVVQEMILQINGTKVCELGAGSGPVTIPVLKALHDAGRLEHYHAIECMPKCISRLNKKIEKLKIGWNEGLFYKKYSGIGKEAPVYVEEAFFGQEWQTSVPNLFIPNEYFDTIISTLPWTQLSMDAMKGILNRSLELLKPGGKLLWISLLGARKVGKLKKAVQGLKNPEAQKQYTEQLEFIDGWIKEHFDQTKTIIWSNCTPLTVYCATKKATNQSPKKTELEDMQLSDNQSK